MIAMTGVKANRRKCSRCQAWLAADNTADTCRPCARALRNGLASPPEVPRQFWDDEELRNALIVDRHIGRVIRRYRQHPYHGRKITIGFAANWLGVSQGQLSRIERDRRPVESLDRLIQWAKILRIPHDLLWFAMPGDSGIGEFQKAKVSTIPLVKGEVLREFRRSKGWDVPEMARRIRKAANGDSLPSPDSLMRMIHRWEREGLNPSSRAERYQLIYAKVFGVSPDELIYGPSAPQNTNSAERTPGNKPGQLAAINSLPEASQEFRVHSAGFGFTPDDEERIIYAARRPSRVDSSVAVPLAKVLAAQRETEDEIGSASMIRPVVGQLATIENLVVEARGEARPAILDVAAQWAEYAGWLNTSVGNSSDARSWFDRAHEWAIEADNQTLASTVLSFKGHLAFLLGQIAPMISLTHAAQRSPSVWIGQRAYDAYQEARGLAITGDYEAAIKSAEKGTELSLAANEKNDDRPPWIYYYTPSFFALERGIFYRFLGRDNAAYNDEAISSLTSALDALGEARKSDWAAEYIYHLAYSYMQAGAPDAASKTSLEVLQVASTTESFRLTKRIRGIHARLEKRWPGNTDVTELGMALR